MKLSYVKLILCLAAILVTLFSLWASHILTQDLKDEERRRVEIWAAAMKSLTTADQGADMTLVLQVLESNHTIPVIVADAEGRIIDSRIPPQKIDLEFTRFLGENGIPFAIVFTKADKLSINKVRGNVQTFLRELAKEWEELPPHFITSSQSGTGREELLEYIDTINKEVKEG